MAETQRGLAIVWGVGGLVITGAVANPADVAGQIGKHQSLNLTRSSDSAYVLNQAGATVGKVDYNLKKVIKLTVIPSGAGSLALAKTNLALWLAATPGSVVTFVADGTSADGSFLVNSVTLNKTNNAVSSIDMEVESRDANNITATIT